MRRLTRALVWRSIIHSRAKAFQTTSVLAKKPLRGEKVNIRFKKPPSSNLVKILNGFKFYFIVYYLSEVGITA